MPKTPESCDYILNFVYRQHYIMHSVKYYNAKFAHRVYKEADEYRSLSLVTPNANCNRKMARQDASAEKRFSIRPAGTSAG